MFLLFVGCLFLSPSNLFAENYVEVAENGKIDWSNGIVEAVGVGAPPKNPINLAQARAMAKKAAIIAARQNLLETVMSVRIDSKMLIQNFVTRSDLIHTEFQRFIQHPQVVDISYLPNGQVKATVAIKLTGPFADMLLPKSIRDIHSVKQPKMPSKEEAKAHTGIVLDCRGLKIRPAIVPRIVDEDGNEVYGGKYVNRKFAVQKSMGGYVRGLKAAQANPRVANSPLTVKAIRPAKSGPSDIVISNSDADAIREDPRNLRILQECRVMIVLDSKGR